MKDRPLILLIIGAVILLPLHAVGQTLQQQDAQQILAEIVTHLHCEQGAVIVTDMDNRMIALADCRATEHNKIIY